MSEVDDLLAVAEQTVVEAEKNVEEATEILAEAKTDRDALRRTITRLRGAPPAPVARTPEERTEWRSLTRPEAVLRVLRSHSGPMSPEALRQCLVDVGRE